MKRCIRFSIILLLCSFFIIPSSHSLAQTYQFILEKEIVNVYLNDDGTISIDYSFTFNNSPQASALDFVDIGLPNSTYEINKIQSSINGITLSNIEDSPYVNPGVAIGLDSNAIQPGSTGVLVVNIPSIRNIFFTDAQNSEYASINFSPTWFGSEFVSGSTDLTVTFHFPVEVQPEEPRWHPSPSGWTEEPQTGFDDSGRITYTWQNSAAVASVKYIFGASLPKRYLPENSIKTPSFNEQYAGVIDSLISFSICACIPGFIILIIILSFVGARKRKLQYFPPKIAIEGHGIKRGLTAVEAAVLLEQPLDKVLTMILFGLIKKGAAKINSRDPLIVSSETILPEGLRPYEEKFLQSIVKKGKVELQKALQETMIELVKSVQEKMRGFSRKETITYYKDIVNRAWVEVEEAETPEVKSQKFDDALEWTMMDKNYDDRTRRVFHGGPVFVPSWWHRYDPAFPSSAPQPEASLPSIPSGQIRLPNLPGADFAASIINGVQDFSANTIGSVTDFTDKVTNKTNPLPASSGKSYSNTRSGGCACACACACAGCACACAGGGR